MKRMHGDPLAGYWSGLNTAGLISRETDCNEAIIGSLAPHILILEADDRNRLLHTVAGNAVERMLGTMLRGTGFLDHWDPRDHRLLQDYCHLALTSHRPLRLLSFCGARSFACETMLMPVTPDGTARTRFVGICMALSQEPAATPLRRVQYLTQIGFPFDGPVETPGDTRAPFT